MDTDEPPEEHEIERGKRFRKYIDSMTSVPMLEGYGEGLGSNDLFEENPKELSLYRGFVEKRIIVLSIGRVINPRHY